MDQVSLSVSQLRCACVNENWRDAYLAGKNPSTFAGAGSSNAGGGGITVHGLDFHRIAEDFIDWAVKPESAAEAAALTDENALVTQIQKLGGEKLIESILAAEEIDSAAALSEAFFNFARRLLQLRAALPRFNGWGDVFLGQEVRIENGLLYSGPSGAVFASGVIDSLRLHHSGELEIVDYKLSHGSQVEKELVQVAIYRKLLQKKRPGFEYRGCLEYFLPTLHTQEIDPADLDAIYEKWVTPTLPLLLAKSESVPVSVARTSDATDNASTEKAEAEIAPAVTPTEITGDQLKITVEEKRSEETPPSSPAATTVYLGEQRSVRAEPVTMEFLSLTRHAAFLGGTGSGKTTLALNILEQALAAGIPVILVDRKGDLCRYADPLAWAEEMPDPDARRHRDELRARLDVALFTPGHVGGRSLSINAVPSGLAEVEEHERQQLAKDAAASLAAMLRLRPADAPQIAILAQAIRLLAELRPTEAASISDLTQFINDADPALVAAIGLIDPKLCGKLAQKLQTFELMQGQLLDGRCEKLSADLLLGRGAHQPAAGKTRLSIVSTKFLGDKDTTLFWVAQLLVELGRYASRHPSNALQAMVLFDEADLYLPAISKPSTKEPMENLLRRARSAGIGIMLGTQSPGDFDYKCRENVRSWFVGLVQQPTALEKIKPLLQESSVALEKISRQSIGQFYVLAEGSLALPIQARRNLIKTEQLPEASIITLAKRRS